MNFHRFTKLIALLLTIIFANTYSQIINDPLQGSTIGTIVGGTVTSEGYQPGIGDNHIFYQISPNIIVNGYVEFEVKGFNPSSMPSDENHAFVALYDGRGISEPAPYFYDFRENYFRWNVHWRQNASSIKEVISLAAPTSERLNSNFAVFNRDIEERDWTGEPQSNANYSWPTSEWVTVKVEWKNNVHSVYINGNLAVSNTQNVYHYTEEGVGLKGPTPYDYIPKDFRIWLGSGPGKYNADIGGVTYRNFKVVDLGGTTSSYIALSPSKKTVSSYAGTTSFSVSSDVSWSVSESSSWLNVSPASGSNNGTLTVNYDQNTTSANRSATITVTGDGITRTVTLTQSPPVSNPFITVTPDTFFATSEALAVGQSLFSIESNIDWTVSEETEWLSKSPSTGNGNSNLLIAYTENLLSASRTAQITVSGEGITKNIFVVQAPGYDSLILEISPDSLLLSSSASQQTVSLVSTGEWTITDIPEWITVLPLSGTGNVDLVISYSENLQPASRNANINILSDSLTKALKIVQTGKGVSLSISPKNWNISRYSGSVTYSIESNIDWTIETSNNWITSTITDSSGPATVSIEFLPNSDSLTRIGKIWVKGQGFSDSSTITQEAGLVFAVTAESMPSEGGSLIGVGNYVEGTNVTLTALANSNEGWKFEAWEENNTIVSSDSAYTFIADSAKHFVAKFTNLTDVVSFNDKTRNEFRLYGNYPNPFNPTTTIRFSIPENSDVNISVYNVFGEQVAILLNEYKTAGNHELKFNAINLASGIYFYTLQTGKHSETKKLILMK